MIPTLRTTWGLTGPRPVVGHLDGPERGSVFGALPLVTGRLPTRLVARRRAHGPRAPALPRPRHRHAACARPVQDIGRAYPAAPDPQVGLVIAKASWQRGGLLTKGLHPLPPWRLYRLPSDSPPRHVIERVGNVWRRRATHQRLCPSPARLKQAVRHRLCDDQPLTHRGLA
jgi:hypothetical protein